MKKILLVEDDYQLGEVVKAYLEANLLDVQHVECGEDALKAAKTRNFHCIVLDLTLPDEDGLVILRKLRAFSDIPIIICSARSSVNDRIVGLEFGANDYLTKPFSSKELLLRIGKLTERYHDDQYDTLEFSHFYLDEDAKACLDKTTQQSIPLTFAEYNILKLLVSHSGRVYSRAELIDATAGIEGPENNRAIDVTISRLRKKLEHDPRHPEFLKTSVGFGYFIERQSEHSKVA